MRAFHFALALCALAAPLGRTSAQSSGIRTFANPIDLGYKYAHAVTRSLNRAATNGEAKFWIEPTVDLAASCGLNSKQVSEAETLIEDHVDEIRNAWKKHFPG